MPLTLPQNFLLDTFCLKVSGQEDFEALIRQIDRHTDQLEGVSLKKFSFPYPESMDEMRENIPGPEALLTETLAGNRLLLREKENGKIWFVSDYALSTLAQRLDLTRSAVEEPSLIRNQFLDWKMERAGESTLVVRRWEENGECQNKVFAFLGGKYRGIRLFELCELYGELSADFSEMPDLGPVKCLDWEVSHERASIRFSFPEYGLKLSKNYGWKAGEAPVPCLEFSTSDIGESSLHVQCFWLISGSTPVPGEKYSHKHRGDSHRSLDEMERKVLEMVKRELKRFPDSLDRLSRIAVSPAGFAPDSKRWRRQNARAVKAAFQAALKSIGAGKIIGKKREIILREYLEYRVIRDERCYSAYDLVMEIFRLPETFNRYLEENGATAGPMSEETVRKFRKESIAKAAYIDFSHLLS